MKLYKDKNILRSDSIYLIVTIMVFVLNEVMIDIISDLKIRVMVHEFSRYTCGALLILIVVKILYDYYIIYNNIFMADLKDDRIIINRIIRNTKTEIYYSNIKEIKYSVRNNVGDIVILVKHGTFGTRTIQLTQISYSLSIIKKYLNKNIKFVRLS